MPVRRLARSIRHVAATSRPPQPQAGILFYGRTAQWTKLDGGIEPELKAKIHDEVLAYQALPKLDNNIVIKRTIIPHLARELQKQGKTDVELDHLCRRLAFEAVENQPAAFWHQACADAYKLQLGEGVSNEFPSPSEDIYEADSMPCNMATTASMPSGIRPWQLRRHDPRPPVP